MIDIFCFKLKKNIFSFLNFEKKILIYCPLNGNVMT